MESFALKDVMWRETLYLSFLRVLVAGVIWTVFGYVNSPSTDLWWEVLAMPFAFLFGFHLFFLPLGLIANFLSGIGIPFIGIFTWPGIILVIPADPLIFLVHKIKPDFIQVEKYGFFNPMIIFVLRIHKETPDEKSKRLVRQIADGNVEESLEEMFGNEKDK